MKTRKTRIWHSVKNDTQFPDGTVRTRPLRSNQWTNEERAQEYERKSIVALENGDGLRSDIYAEWARIERGIPKDEYWNH